MATQQEKLIEFKACAQFCVKNVKEFNRYSTNGEFLSCMKNCRGISKQIDDLGKKVEKDHIHLATFSAMETH